MLSTFQTVFQRWIKKEKEEKKVLQSFDKFAPLPFLFFDVDVDIDVNDDGDDDDDDVSVEYLASFRRAEPFWPKRAFFKTFSNLKTCSTKESGKLCSVAGWGAAVRAETNTGSYLGQAL